MAALAAALPGYNIPVKDVMVYAHQAIRQDLVHLEKALEAIDVREDWHVNQLCVWFVTFYDLFFRHHEVEETIVNPWLSTRATVPAKIAGDHAQLTSWLDDMHEQLQLMTMTNSTPKRQLALVAARKVFAEFSATTREHLQEEESALPYQMRSHFTLEEYKAVMHRVLSAEGLGTFSTTLPWLEGTMEPHERAQFEADLPGYVVLTLRKKWLPAFQRHQQLIRSIYDSSVPPAHKSAPLPTCWICV